MGLRRPAPALPGRCGQEAHLLSRFNGIRDHGRVDPTRTGHPLIYLDHAATTPLSETAWRAMEPVLRRNFGNPSELHAAGRAARSALDAARAGVAVALGATPEDVVFTGGGTEADNVAVGGRLQGGRPGGRVVASVIEHPAVRERLVAFETAGGEVAWIGTDEDGVVRLDALVAAVRPGDLLCCLMAANNVTGVVQPVEAAAAACAAAGVPLHVDAVQAASGRDVDVGRLGPRAPVAVAAHKLGGPKGVGALVGPGVRELAPVVFGGGQEAGLRSGTENVAGAAALAAVLAERQGASAPAERARRGARRDRLEHGAAREVAGVRAPRLPGHALLLAGVRGDTLVHLLDGEGICVAAGSACAAGDAAPSYVLAAMGFEPGIARGALRVTLGPETTDDEVDAFLAALARVRVPLARAAAGLA